MILSFLGISGCGKDTQADFLVKDFNFTKISSGEVIRKFTENPITEQAIQLKNAMEKGEWVDDTQLYEIIYDYLKQNNVNGNVIFVGAVRKESQIKLFENLLSKMNWKLDKTIIFELSQEQAIKRLSSRWYCPKCQTTYDYQYKPPKNKGFCDKDNTNLQQRPDDTPDSIKARMQNFNTTIKPILEYYQNKDLLIKINAENSIQQIKNDMYKVLDFKV